MDIPAVAPQADRQQDEIPQSVAELPEKSEAPEAMPYVISFAKYNDKMCEIHLLDSNKAKKALETLKQIGTKIACEADFQRHHIERKSIARLGDYKRLYNKLSEDIDIKEIELQQDARIFYFDIEAKRTLFVVAITKNHLETDKVRR